MCCVCPAAERKPSWTVLSWGNKMWPAEVRTTFRTVAVVLVKCEASSFSGDNSLVQSRFSVGFPLPQEATVVLLSGMSGHLWCGGQ